MSFESKLGRLSRNTGPARFLFTFGLALIVIGILLITFFGKSYVKTTGTVTSVTEGDFDEEQNVQQYDVGFSYDVKGTAHSGTFENKTGSYKIGDSISVYYEAANPGNVADRYLPAYYGPVAIGLGVLVIAFGIFRTVRLFKKSKALDEAAPPAETVSFDGFTESEGVSEYYFRWDGKPLTPGYIIEDTERNPLFEGKAQKFVPVGGRPFVFTDHITGAVTEHKVGHVVTQTYNNSGFSAKSWFKLDGENVWDCIHERGIRLTNDLLNSLPRPKVLAAKDGLPFAVIQYSGVYVHEEDEAQHKFNIPTSRMYYRFWTNSRDFESLFLILFALTECHQLLVE